jgi:hypothetical protein
MALLFSEHDHRYFYQNKPDIKLTSVSTLIGLYHEKFDTERIAKRYAEKNGRNVEDVLKEWKANNEESIKRGHGYHSFREEKFFKDAKKHNLNVLRHEEESGFKKAFDIEKLSAGIYPELIIDLPEFFVVGTSDYVEIFEDKTFIISDFKTNKELKFEGFPVWNPNTLRKEPKKMFAPIQHIHDCEGGHYSLQLSIYAYGLECAGFELREGGLTIEHILFDEDGQAVDSIIYPINYLKKEVKNLLQHFKITHLKIK